MARKKSTDISLIILGVVALAVIGYFVWMFLAPPPAVVIDKKFLPTEVQTGVVGDEGFRILRPYADLPIHATRVGRINPFMPFAINVNAEVNANTPVGNTNTAGAPTNTNTTEPTKTLPSGQVAPPSN